MAGMYGSFGDIKKVVGTVLILMVVAFSFGYCKGLESGRKEVISQPSETPLPAATPDNVMPPFPTSKPKRTPVPFSEKKKATTMPGTEDDDNSTPRQKKIMPGEDNSIPRKKTKTTMPDDDKAMPILTP